MLISSHRPKYAIILFFSNYVRIYVILIKSKTYSGHTPFLAIGRSTLRVQNSTPIFRQVSSAARPLREPHQHPQVLADSEVEFPRKVGRLRVGL